MFRISAICIFLQVLLTMSTDGDTVESYIDDCASLLNNFATSAADFMLCAVSNARPIRMCSSCVGSYSSVLEDHRKILEISESDNFTCKDRLINLDRLEIIEAGFIYVTQLWDKGRCPNCFEYGSSHPTKETTEFQRLYSVTDTCLVNNYNGDNNTYNEDVCKNCSTVYQQISLFYNSLIKKFGDGNICMDIVDSMNITQNLWSGTLHCGEELRTQEGALIGTCTAILCLPIIFYLAAWKMSLTSPSLISEQKRLSTRFVELLRNRTASMISQRRQS